MLLVVSWLLSLQAIRRSFSGNCKSYHTIIPAVSISYNILFFLFFVFCVPQLYLWGSPLLGEIFAYVTVF